MITLDKIKVLSEKNDSKIIFLIMDGLGGLPRPETGKTELETAKTPNLDLLASKGVCGVVDPVSRGITPGSGPGHLGLFGYDPLKFDVGRGILEALGIDFDLKDGDVATRGNFCTVDKKGLVVDRRAGRISTETNAELCKKLAKIRLTGAELIVEPVREHRLLVVFRGSGLTGDVADTDPQQLGLPPLKAVPHNNASKKVAEMANEFIDKAKEVLAESHPANMVLLRGFSSHPDMPSMQEIFKLNPAAIASYPMYRGLAKLVGMKVLPTGVTIEDELNTLHEHYDDYDFFFIHVKKTDSYGEDGNFDAKVGVIEEVDSLLPRITDLQPDVIVVTGDHSTPALLQSHSWHPVPILLYSKWCRPDRVKEFAESECHSGGLGRFLSMEIMPTAMAHALKLAKYGA